MTVHTGLLRLETEGEGQIVDLTEGVLAVVRQSGVSAGLVGVFVVGSTAAVTTMAFEPGAVADAGLRAAVIGPSETVPIVAGRLVLGERQQLVLIDFADRPRQREIHVQVVS